MQVEVKNPEIVDAFFAEHPEANVCYVALGVVKATLEEAEAFLAGVKGKMAVRYTREEGKQHAKDSDALLELVIRFEEEEQKAHEAFDLSPTEDNMKTWKDAQANVVKAKAEYDRIVAEEKKLEGGVVAEGEACANEGGEVVAPIADAEVVVPGETTEE